MAETETAQLRSRPPFPPSTLALPFFRPGQADIKAMAPSSPSLISIPAECHILSFPPSPGRRIGAALSLQSELFFLRSRTSQLEEGPCLSPHSRSEDLNNISSFPPFPPRDCCPPSFSSLSLDSRPFFFSNIGNGGAAFFFFLRSSPCRRGYCSSSLSFFIHSRALGERAFSLFPGAQSFLYRAAPRGLCIRFFSLSWKRADRTAARPLLFSTLIGNGRPSRTDWFFLPATCDAEVALLPLFSLLFPLDGGRGHVSFFSLLPPPVT